MKRVLDNCALEQNKRPKEDVALLQSKKNKLLFTFQLAQDLVLDEVIVPLTKMRPSDSLKRNLPSHVWNSFVRKPTFSLFNMLASLGEDVNIVEPFMMACPSFLSDLSKYVDSDEHRMLFMTFVIRMVDTLFFGKELQFYWRDDIGVGMKTAAHFTKGSLLTTCWGMKVELDGEDFQALLSSDSGTCAMTLCDKGGEQTQKHYALFGPLSFLKRACKRCFTVSLDATCNCIFESPVEITSELLTLCFVQQDRLCPGQELTYLWTLGACAAAAHTNVCIPGTFRYSVPQRKINN